MATNYAVSKVNGHRKRESWYTSSSSPPTKQIVGSPVLQQEEVDLDDAFDSRDEDSPQPFSFSQNALKRESMGSPAVPPPPSDDDPVHDALPNSSDAEALQEVSLNDDPVQEPKRISLKPLTTTWREHPPTPPEKPQQDPEKVSPIIPSIVLSQEGSPDVEIQASRFVNIALDAPRPQSTSPRSPQPKPIIVPPRDEYYDVQVSQSPGPSTPNHASSFSNNARKPSLTNSVAVSANASNPSTFKPKRSSGISTQDVISKTRPTHLPPKSKQEDTKHLRDWEDMMEKARLAEEQRVEIQRQRRLQRERAVEESTWRWEREVLPNLKAAIRDPALRKLWWKGIPAKLRGRVWYLTLGNALALSKDSYRSCASRAKRAIASNSFPKESMRLIEEDILQTLPALHLFHPETGPMYQDLKDLLCAWLVSRSDEGLAYVRGASAIGAMFLINLPAEQAFISMRNLLERHCLRSFYGGPGTKEDVEAYYRIFDTLLADGMPKVYFNFKQHTITPAEYLRDWVLTVFLHHLPFEVCVRIWDVVILEGDSFLFKAAIGILSVIESRLFFPDRKELMEVLRGENKAALEAARRAGVANVDMGARYEQYGMTEEALWDRIESMDEWWKESTWQRLSQRELPDI